VNTSVAAAPGGVIAGAGTFNGTSATVAIDDAPALNPSLISIDAWVKTTNANLISIFNKDQSNGGTNRVWQFRLNAGKAEFVVFNATTNATAASPDAILDNQFHHLCGTWDGNTIRTYVDGALKGSTAFVGSLHSGQTNKAFIGRGENAAAAFFNGVIDEVRLSPVARSADWIRASWDNQKPSAAFITAAPSAVPDLDGDHLPDAWEMAHFNSTYGSNADPDADGLENLIEFALGSDPNSGAAPPGLILLPASATSPCEFIYPQIAGGVGAVGTTYTAAALRYAVEVSSDLTTWHGGPSYVTWSTRREVLPNGMERVGVHLTAPSPATPPRVFARLRVMAVN
jgi:hypothetical protein